METDRRPYLAIDAEESMFPDVKQATTGTNSDRFHQMPRHIHSRSMNPILHENYENHHEYYQNR